MGFALTLCGDEATDCERQARARALEEFEEEIRDRTAAYADTHPGVTNARDIVIQAKYKELGLDKVEEARERMLKDFDTVKWRPPVLYNGPQMHAG